MRELNITSAQKGQRMDKFLMKYMNRAPKSFVYKMLRKKNIKLNNKKAEGNEILSEGDSIKLFLSDDTINEFMRKKKIKPVSKNFHIVFEDENVIICSKPSGVICHPDKENKTNTLNDALLYYLYEKGEYDISAESDFTPSICNRLDRNTSGLVVMGKNLEAVQELNRAFRERLANKFYITVVRGIVDKEGIVEGYHTKSDNNIASIGEKGSYILTKFKPVKSNDKYSLLEVKLETGKSHQIRICLAHINHPVIGDNKYGDINVNRYFRDKFGLKNQLLHSHRLIFNFDKGPLSYLNGREFKVDLPDDKNKIVKFLFN